MFSYEKLLKMSLWLRILEFFEIEEKVSQLVEANPATPSSTLVLTEALHKNEACNSLPIDLYAGSGLHGFFHIPLKVISTLHQSCEVSSATLILTE